MRKGNQVKVLGEYPFCGREGIVKYSWPQIYRYITAEERQAWYDSDESKGMNCAGETKLPPTCAQVKFEGGTIVARERDNLPGFTINESENIKLSDDTFTVVRSRCAPVLGYHKHNKMTLVRNNRTGEEGFIRRDRVEVIDG